MCFSSAVLSVSGSEGNHTAISEHPGFHLGHLRHFLAHLGIKTLLPLGLGCWFFGAAGACDACGALWGSLFLLPGWLQLQTSGCKARNLCKAVTVCLPKPESKGPGLQPRCVRNFCRARMVAAPMSPSSLPLYKGGDSLSSSFFKKFWRAMADFLPQEPSTLQSCSSSCKNCWKSSVFFPPSRTPLLKSWKSLFGAATPIAIFCTAVEAFLVEEFL